MRTVRIKLYKFSELSKEAQQFAIDKHIDVMLNYEDEYHYLNWPAYKKAIDRANELQTPWFAASYIWDYCKDGILDALNERDDFTNTGSIH